MHLSVAWLTCLRKHLDVLRTVSHFVTLGIQGTQYYMEADNTMFKIDFDAGGVWHPIKRSFHVRVIHPAESEEKNQEVTITMKTLDGLIPPKPTEGIELMPDGTYIKSQDKGFLEIQPRVPHLIQQTAILASWSMDPTMWRQVGFQHLVCTPYVQFSYHSRQANLEIAGQNESCGATWTIQPRNISGVPFQTSYSGKLLNISNQQLPINTLNMKIDANQVLYLQMKQQHSNVQLACWPI